jgi:hypothetical protein
MGRIMPPSLAVRPLAVFPVDDDEEGRTFYVAVQCAACGEVVAVEEERPTAACPSCRENLRVAAPDER